MSKVAAALLAVLAITGTSSPLTGQATAGGDAGSGAQDAAVRPSARPDTLPPPRGSAVVLGRVVSGDAGVPLPSAEVELLFASDSLPVASTLTNADGLFRMERMPEGVFFLRLSSVGYGSASTESFEVAAAERRNVGELALSVQVVELEPITVSAERAVVTYEADRTRYNVGVMPGTEGASVTETLATIPELEVDIDGRITLRNSTVTVHIDGREAPMSGEALALFLEQFPADYLQEIEVIDNPSARYDAEGTGGIVNLVTREGVELGWSGSVFANAGTRGQYGIGGRSTLQRGAWTVNGGGFVRLSETESTGWDLRQNLVAEPPFRRQDSWSDRSGLSGNVDLEVEYEPTADFQVFVEGRVAGSGSDSEGLTTTAHLDESETPILVYDRLRASDGRDVSYDFATGFDWEWEPSEQELEVELELERGTDREDGRDEISEASGTGQDAWVPAELTLEDEDEVETELTVEVDYARALGDAMEMEVGYRGERNRSELGRLIRLVEDPAAEPEGALTDRGHDELERSHAVYATLERRFGELSVEGGLRAEHVDQRFQVPGGDPFGAARWGLFPSANLSYRVGEDWRMRLSYSRRVERPGISVLNPMDLSTDPLERRVGNPDIEPEFTHSVSLNASRSLGGGSLRFSPYFRTNRNGWAEITTVDDAGVSTRTWENVASTERYGASLTYSLRRGGGWRMNLSVSAAHERRDASNLADRYSGSFVRYSSRANITGPITEDLSAQGRFSYDPPTDLPQGRRDARYRANLGLRYRLLDDRASLRLQLRDPFGLRRSSRTLRDVDYVLLGRSRESTRSAELSVSYSLGGGGEMRGRGRRGRR